MRSRLIAAMATSAVLAGSPLASQVPADDSARVETVKKHFVVGRMEEFHAQMLQMALERYAQVPALAAYAEPMRAFLNKHGSFAAIEADMIALYREYYSETDLQQLIQFQETPLGRKVTAVTPVLSARVSQMSMDRMNRLLPELMRELGLPKPPGQ